MFDLINKICKSEDRLLNITKELDYLNISYLLQKYDQGVNIQINFGESSDFVIGAHYDSIDGTPGANDNVASVVQLIELSKRLKNLKLKKDVSIVLFDKEESLCCGRIEDMGSLHYISELKRKEKTPRFALILDVCGYGDTFVFSKGKYVEKIKFMMDFVIKNNKKYNIISTPPSDDISFDKFRIPNVLMTMLPQEEVFGNKNTWSRIHTMEDSPETISFETMESVIDILTNLVVSGNFCRKE